MTKNIHVLPTNKPSKLYFNSLDKKYQLCEFPKYHTDIKSTYNIYIISDEEKVSEGDYYELNGSIFCARPRDEGNFNKIILTTDVALIKNGVQAIDDEFLEWFVKNPSCDRVDIDCKYTEFLETVEELRNNIGITPQVIKLKNSYQIIIPKEEPLYDYGWCKGNVVLPQEETKQVGQITEKGIIDTIGNCANCGVEFHIHKDVAESKQETLEEAAEKYCLINNIPIDQMIIKYDRSCEFKTPVTMFIKGAKWQQERMYSEEEVLKLLHNREQYLIETLREFYKSNLEWFEQYKKK